jgi:hypothetical protein
VSSGWKKENNKTKFVCYINTLVLASIKQDVLVHSSMLDNDGWSAFREACSRAVHICQNVVGKKERKKKKERKEGENKNVKMQPTGPTPLAGFRGYAIRF